MVESLPPLAVPVSTTKWSKLNCILLILLIDDEGLSSATAQAPSVFLNPVSVPFDVKLSAS